MQPKQNPEEIESAALSAGFRPLRDFARDLKPGDVIEVIVDELWRGDLCVKARLSDGGWAILDLSVLARKSDRILRGGK
jgi:hypothetical protein